MANIHSFLFASGFVKTAKEFGFSDKEAKLLFLKTAAFKVNLDPIKEITKKLVESDFVKNIQGAVKLKNPEGFNVPDALAKKTNNMFNKDVAQLTPKELGLGVAATAPVAAGAFTGGSALAENMGVTPELFSESINLPAHPLVEKLIAKQEEVAKALADAKSVTSSATSITPTPTQLDKASVLEKGKNFISGLSKDEAAVLAASLGIPLGAFVALGLTKKDEDED